MGLSSRWRARIALAVCGGTLAVGVGVPAPPAAADPPAGTLTAELVAGPNTVTLEWTSSGATWLAYIFGTQLDDADNNGTTHDVGWVPPNGSRTFRTTPGMHEYVLALDDGAGNATHVRAEVYVPPPSMPSPAEDQLSVDPFADPIPAQTITWNPNGADYVKVYACQPNTESLGCTSISNVSAPNNSYTITATELSAALGSSMQGDIVYRLQPCMTSADPKEEFCAQFMQGSAWVDVSVQPAQFTGNFRDYRPNYPAFFDYTVSWDGPGDGFRLNAPTLGLVNHETSATSYTFPAANLGAGVHTLELTACHQAVTGQRCASVPARKQLVVGNSGWTVKPWTNDFNPTTGANPSEFFDRGQFERSGNSSANAIDGTGDVWSVGEQSGTLSHVDGDTVSSYDIPLLRRCPPAPEPCTYVKRVTPFGWGPGTGQADISSPQDLTEVDGQIWFTQGMDLHGPDAHNHSRVFRFDPAATDSPATVQDDRFCGYNVPEEENAAAGVVFDGSRAWFLEHRTLTHAGLASALQEGMPTSTLEVTPLKAALPAGHEILIKSGDRWQIVTMSTAAADNATTLEVETFTPNFTYPGGSGPLGNPLTSVSDPSYLTSFNPSDPAFSNCHAQNTLDYTYPPGPAFSPGYCDPDPAVQANCFERVALPGSLRGAAHLVVDADDDAIWMTTYMLNEQLGRYDLTTGAVTFYPLPSDSIPWGPLTGVVPWKVEVSGDYVYVSEYQDGDIVRFDKTAAPRAECETLDAIGQNPCMSEIHLPGNSAFQTQVRGNRLYFTVRGRSPGESNLGYINLTDWRTGVIYTGMSDALVPESRQYGPSGQYSWIDIDQASGQISLSDFHRRQLIRLQPKSP